MRKWFQHSLVLYFPSLLGYLVDSIQMCKSRLKRTLLMVHMIYYNHEIKSWATCPVSKLIKEGIIRIKHWAWKNLTLFRLKFPVPLYSCFIEICIWELQEEREWIYSDYKKDCVADGSNQEKIVSKKRKSLCST